MSASLATGLCHRCYRGRCCRCTVYRHDLHAVDRIARNGRHYPSSLCARCALEVILERPPAWSVPGLRRVRQLHLVDRVELDRFVRQNPPL